MSERGAGLDCQLVEGEMRRAEGQRGGQFRFPILQ